MSMGYKKDAFAVFAYEFELSHKYCWPIGSWLTVII